MTKLQQWRKAETHAMKMLKKYERAKKNMMATLMKKVQIAQMQRKKAKQAYVKERTKFYLEKGKKRKK